MTWSIIWRFLVHDIAMPGAISYFSVYLDQMWHARREFKACYARSKALAEKSVRLPDKMTIMTLFTAALYELQYRSEQDGKKYETVVATLKREVPGLEERMQCEL